MIAILVMLGALPFVVGGIQNWYMLTYMDSLIPYALISVCFLIVWGCIAFFLKGNRQRTRTIVMFLNLIAVLDLLLVGIQELIFQAYWLNPIGLWSQLFYLPLLDQGSSLTTWSHGMFPAYAASCILMITASFLGCKLREKMMK